MLFNGPLHRWHWHVGYAAIVEPSLEVAALVWVWHEVV